MEIRRLDKLVDELYYNTDFILMVSMTRLYTGKEQKTCHEDNNVSITQFNEEKRSCSNVCIVFSGLLDRMTDSEISNKKRC